MELTPKQEKFAQYIADGMSQADAYRTAYDVSASTKASTVQVNASKLMSDTNVSLRVEELRKQLSDISVWDRADSVEVLAQIARGIESTNMERISSVKELNAMHGFNKTTLDHTSSDGTFMPTLVERVIIRPGDDRAD
jgi:phage terminase small subunit